MSDYAVIIAARNSSERLPDKAIVSYCPDGTSNLLQIIRRWEVSKRSPAIVVATSDGPADDSIAAICRENHTPCYRAPVAQVESRDVLTQINDALKTHVPDARYIARALADNPLVDVDLADWRYDVLCETGVDGLYYGGNEARLTYAATTDIFSREAWDRFVALSRGPEREHPGAHFWANIAKYSAVQLPLPRREYLAPVRTELDTPEDLAMFRVLWHYAPETVVYSTVLALETLAKRPEIAALNAHVEARTQSKPAYGRGAAFVCRDCQRRTGTVDAGNLIMRCAHCGKSQKFYSTKPVKPSQMHY